MNEEELAEIEQRCVRATAGPWESCVEGRDCTSGESFIMTGGPDLYISGATTADLDFIAAARQDIIKLVLEIRRLRGVAG
jgi:hypothetical protein